MAYNIEILFLTLNSGIYSLSKSLKEHLEEKKTAMLFILDTTCKSLPFLQLFVSISSILSHLFRLCVFRAEINLTHFFHSPSQWGCHSNMHYSNTKNSNTALKMGVLNHQNTLVWQRLNLMISFNKTKHKERHCSLEAHMQSLRLSSSDSSAPGWPVLPREISGKNAIKNSSNKTPPQTTAPVYIYIYVATKGVGFFFCSRSTCLGISLQWLIHYQF